MRLFALIVQLSVSFLFEITINKIIKSLTNEEVLSLCGWDYSNRKSFINRSRVRASSSFMRMLAQNHQIYVVWESQNLAPVW